MRKEFLLLALFLAFSVAAQLPIATYRAGSWATLSERLVTDSQISTWWGMIFWPAVIALVVLVCFFACWLLWERAVALSRVLVGASTLVVVIMVTYSLIESSSMLMFTGGVPLALLIVVTRTQRRLRRAPSSAHESA